MFPVAEVGTPELWSPLPALLLAFVAAVEGASSVPAVSSKDLRLVRELDPEKGRFSFGGLVPVNGPDPPPSSLISDGSVAFTTFKTVFLSNIGLVVEGFLKFLDFPSFFEFSFNDNIFGI